MREILFRGRRTDNHQWVYGYLVFDSCENPNPYIIARRKYRIEHKSIGQFTGLLDKNGKRVFEGDVVRIEHDDWSFDGETIEHRVEEGFIDYDGSMTIGLVVEQYNGIVVRSPFFHRLALADQIRDWSIEVIGTIYDNPELLEVTPDE